MSIKRQATTDLNHENWDQDDPSEHEEMGTFKSASKDVLEKRVIRTAKRRSQASGDQANKSVFSGFSGFNKTQPSSFDFLANLTNGSKTTNGTTTSKADTATSSSLFSSKPNSGLFSTSESSSTPKPTFGIPTTQTSLPEGQLGGSKPTMQSPFAVSKSESSTTDSPFKVQSSPIGSDASVKDTKTENATFGTTSVFSMNKDNTSPFKMSNTTPKLDSTGTSKEKSLDDKNEDKKLKYYAKLKGLNVSVSDWIKKHVEETPLCILTPIFKDYEKYLKEIQDEFEGAEDKSNKPSENLTLNTKSNNVSAAEKTSDSGSSLFSNANKKANIFGVQLSGEKPSGFAFGINTSTSSSKTTSSGGFSFGINSAPQTTTATNSSTFSLETKPGAAPAASAPFSFGTGKPFSFSPNTVQKPAEVTTEAGDEQDEPPKVEFTPIVEENSVFDKRCKIFVKKDGNFADRGVGTLYIKKVEDSGKHQLLVRANTNLGTILLNIILSSSVPTQRLGKNNVMLVCIPTPDAKPPPTSVLIRVKTPEEADDLLETLNKYKA